MSRPSCLGHIDPTQMPDGNCNGNKENCYYLYTDDDKCQSQGHHPNHRCLQFRRRCHAHTSKKHFPRQLKVAFMVMMLVLSVAYVVTTRNLYKQTSSVTITTNWQAPTTMPTIASRSAPSPAEPDTTDISKTKILAEDETDDDFSFNDITTEAPSGAITTEAPSQFMCYGVFHHEPFLRGSLGISARDPHWCESTMPTASIEPSEQPMDDKTTPTIVQTAMY